MIDEILDDLFLDPSVSQFKRTKKKTSTPITPVKDDPLRQMIQEQKDLSASTPHEKPIEPSSRASADQPKEDPVETLWKEQEQILLQDQPISKKKSTSPSVSRESQEQRLERKSIVKNYYEQETQEVEAQKETKPADAKESVKKDEDWYLDQAYNVTSGTTKKDTQDWANFTPRWMKKPTTESQPMQPTPESITEKYDPSLLNLSDVVSQLKAEKAQNITVINMREKCDYADYFIIAEGASKRQIYGIADGVRRFVCIIAHCFDERQCIDARENRPRKRLPQIHGSHRHSPLKELKPKTGWSLTLAVTCSTSLVPSHDRPMILMDCGHSFVTR